ncbi:glycogen debranching protein GlgX [Sphingomonas aquatilis]|uniref:Glycogen operon protein n=1 Tax=Sphingomonas aquatilis TaxID=93063 RepID=A0AAW3TYE9_9SPHN|nr:glycogen debranching protein GlgX [Sphingomonas aquatilis]MBB3876979.1 glycogen operon protein [Sphingomonas aquatilis]MCI4652660.1 glycogen debranching protein GlgX [Sphingomonas aquatilis]GEM71324.1 glycogen operon protein GlgX homolog [Sphingomonas aquatilis NBRC 16722]
MSVSLGAEVVDGGTRFAVRSATPVTLCLFDDAGERRIAMTGADGVWHAEVKGAGVGTHYGYHAASDSAKLLVDPYAIQLDRPFHYDPCLGEPGIDTTALVPRAIVTPPPTVPVAPALFTPGGLIYELNVRGFTMLHPDVPEAQRGTIAALAHPAVIAHLKKLKVAAIELMPIVAWIDERHLPPLGLTNSWGYNPVVPMAIDPRLAPGGVAELVETVAALRSAGIGVILDLVFNHTGESDRLGPTLSLRGFDEALYYAHAPDGSLVNDTGTGNTLDCNRPEVRALILDSLRHFARCGVDGFRFDLATILARGPGFDPHAPIFAEIAADPLLASRVMIAEPWDIGPGGYQLGQFPDHWLEWNDRYRDDVRRFWRGDGSAGDLATRIAGSADLFGPGDTRTVNFLAAHDGFTLADLVSYAERHNHANGEDNRDGHGDNLSWNNGVEGPSDDPAIRQRRRDGLRALLATLFASRGTIMLTAGDEFGRTQQGNNNAYAQDNAIGWIDWQNRDRDLEDFVAALAAFRAANRLDAIAPYANADWRALDGEVMTPGRWHDAPGFELRLADGGAQIVLRIDRQTRRVSLSGRTIVESR